ncbi:type II toxin-antitoxin system VapC family toxin [Neisseria leonii]|uniref:type II toxin-antitoxin system VapC family toxin n=1 Tax=Neisseria leonii TaxID=2995413 RepID=UPI00237B66B8|nr:type II toxin-antitoxin system VapC family toxin [Neisseria sp. 3986]MDD9325178.1 type II toxin-antitoxin system VapC family toxin [Neisseria sp. 3986]
MYLIDTNVISELMRPVPNAGVLAWLDSHHPLYISSITQAELLFGVYRMAESKRKTAYLAALQEMFEQDFIGRIIGFDTACTTAYAEICCRRFAVGKPIHTADAQIAAIALTYGMCLTTRNTKDFTDIDGLTLINPFV